MTTQPIEPGRLQSALIPNERTNNFYEVFSHPDTANELVAQSGSGILKVNGQNARAVIVDVMGNGDHLVRLTVKEAA